MPPARVLWVAAPGDRPADVPSVELRTANTQAAAMDAVESLAGSDGHLDAVVAAPALSDGDGSAVLRAVRDRWPDAACFLHGNLWAIPEGSTLPVCEFHPTTQSPAAVADAVTEAVRGRYHRPYPVSRSEDRRLEVVDAVDFEAARDDLDRLVAEAEAEAEVDAALVSVVDDHTVWVAAASDDLDRTVLRRGDSACTYAIDESGPTVIEDIQADERLAHVDDACDRGRRSYAGRPLTVDGHAVGALVVLGRDAGGFSAVQMDALSRYADEVERVLGTVR